MGARSVPATLTRSCDSSIPKSSLATKPIGSISVGFTVSSAADGLVMRTVGAWSGRARTAKSSGRFSIPAESVSWIRQLPSSPSVSANSQVTIGLPSRCDCWFDQIGEPSTMRVAFLTARSSFAPTWTFVPVTAAISPPLPTSLRGSAWV